MTNLQVDGAGGGAVVLTWTNPAALDGVIVRYSQVEAPATPTAGTGVPLVGQPDTVTVDGLTNSVNYHFSVFAALAGATSPPESAQLSPFDCPDLSTALDAGTLVTSASWVACSAPDANANDSTLTTVLRKTGATQALMTTGDKEIANPPSDDTVLGEGRQNGTGWRGGFDVSIFKLQLDVPPAAACLKFDYVFASDEYPEFVGQPYNDGFLAQLDQANWAVNGATGDVVADGNFARLPNGEVVSISSRLFYDKSRVFLPATNGTGYDGMSVPLSASTPITPGPHSIYLSIFDAYDDKVDSAAFLDNLRTTEVPCVVGSNQDPVAGDDAASTNVTTPVTVDVIANDTDLESDTPLTVFAHGPANQGTVSCGATTCTYTPTGLYTGPDSFTYTVSDARGGIDTGHVSVTIVNRPPVAGAGSASVYGTVPGSFDVLQYGSDPDGHPLTVTSGSPTASHGTVSCTAAGTCSYTANAQNPPYVGADSFEYTISDGHGGTATGQVTMTVLKDAVKTASLSVSSPSVVWPAQVTVNGTVGTTHGSEPKNVPVELWAKPAGGSYAKVGQASSSQTGNVSMTVRPATATTYQWRVVDPDYVDQELSSAEQIVDVTPLVTIAATPARLAVGDTLKVTGKATPTRVGTPVELQRLSGATWSTVATSAISSAVSTLTATAPYTVTTKSTQSGAFRYRVLIPADDGRLEVVSAERTVTFYAAKIMAVHATGDEYVTVKNTGKVSINLSRWALRNRAGRAVTLPSRTVAVGGSLKIHIGRGRSDARNLYLGKSAMLGNRHDSVALMDNRGYQVSRFTY